MTKRTPTERVEYVRDYFGKKNKDVAKYADEVLTNYEAFLKVIGQPEDKLLKQIIKGTRIGRHYRVYANNLGDSMTRLLHAFEPKTSSSGRFNTLLRMLLV